MAHSYDYESIILICVHQEINKHWINVLHFLYKFFDWGESRLFPGSDDYE